MHDVMERGVADDLGGLLARSASGDVEAFARFYDATSAQAYTLALARCRARGLKAAAVRRDAAAEVERRFLLAWRLNAARTSGLLRTVRTAPRISSCSSAPRGMKPRMTSSLGLTRAWITIAPPPDALIESSARR